MKRKTTHWMVKSVQRIARDGAIITLHAGGTHVFDCDDLSQRWPRSHEPNHD